MLLALDSDTAMARLDQMLSPNLEPVLDSDDMDLILDQAKRADSAGNSPSSDDWNPTWDLEAAAVIGWEIKAGRAASTFDFGEDSQRFNASQVHDQCMAMARLYRRGSGSARAASVQVGDYLNAKAATTPIGPAIP